MELKLILEVLLFSVQKPLTVPELRDLLVRAAEQTEEPEPREFKKVSAEQIGAALAELERDHESARRSYRLVGGPGAWQFVSRPAYVPWLKAVVGERARPPRLSLAALETLAIIAYRQPLTRAEIEQIRGVSVDGVMQTLMERGLVEAVGRADVIGRPPTYGTTSLFLDYFGLRNLEDLPEADELRRISMARPASLATAGQGLATVPPDPLTLGESTEKRPVVSAPSTSPETRPSADPSAPQPAPPRVSDPDPSSSQ